MSHIKLLVFLGHNFGHAIPKRRSTIIIERPNSIFVVRITFTIQKVIDVASPFVVFTLASCFVPIIPVLATRILIFNVVVAISVLTIRFRVLVVDTVLIISVVILILAITKVI